MNNWNERSGLVESYSDDAIADPRRERDDSSRPARPIDRTALRLDDAGDAHGRATSFPPPAAPANGLDALAVMENAQVAASERAAALHRSAPPGPGNEFGRPAVFPLAAPMSFASRPAIARTAAAPDCPPAPTSSAFPVGFERRGSDPPAPDTRPVDGRLDAPQSSIARAPAMSPSVLAESRARIAQGAYVRPSSDIPPSEAYARAHVTRIGSKPPGTLNPSSPGMRRPSVGPDEVERVSQLRREVAQLRTELATLQRQLAEQAEERANDDGLAEELANRVAEADWLRQTLDEALAEREQLRAAAIEQNATLQAMHNEHTALAPLQAQLAAQALMRDEAERRRNELEAALVKTSTERDVAVSAHDTLAVEFETQSLAAARSERELAKARTDIHEMQAKLAAVEESVKRVQTALDEALAAQEVTRATESTLQTQLSSLEAQIASRDAEVKGLADQLAAASAARSIQSEVLAKTQAALTAKERALHQQVEAAATTKSEHESFVIASRERVAAFEGLAKTLHQKHDGAVRELEARAQERATRVEGLEARINEKTSELAVLSGRHNASESARARAADELLGALGALAEAKRELGLAEERNRTQKGAHTKLAEALERAKTELSLAEMREAELRGAALSSHQLHQQAKLEIAAVHARLQALADERDEAKTKAEGELAAASKLMEEAGEEQRKLRAQLEAIATKVTTDEQKAFELQREQVELLVKAQSAWHETSRALEAMRKLTLGEPTGKL